MKYLNTADVTTTNGLPLKAGSLVHIQSAYKEAIAEAIKSQMAGNYNPVTPYRLTGLINTAGSVSAGSIFYNGEVYLVDAFSLPSPANASIDTTYFTAVEADPVEFTDGTPRSIHEIRKIVFGTPAELGFNFTALQDLGQVGYINTNSTPSPTITFDKKQNFFRSFAVTGETAVTINLSATGAKDGVECIFMFQNTGGTTRNITHNSTFTTAAMGIGGYTNPLVVSVSGGGFFVVRYRSYVSGSNSLVSIELLENN